MSAEAVPEIPVVGNCDTVTCVGRGVLTHLASKWAPLVLRQLRGGDRRYSELRVAIGGISEKMLAQTLRELERDGLISRTSYPVVPPHVVYALTPLGRGCADRVGALLGWIEAHVRELRSAQRAYDVQDRGA
jgi:DNA-binding HxlR family transcriptional regulator